MPPITPSPHRFLPGRKQDTSSEDGKKLYTPKFSRGDGFDEAISRPATKIARSVKRTVASSGDGFAQSTPKSISSSRQFAQTPRFGCARPASLTFQATQPELLRPYVRPTNTEEVEDAPSQESNDDDEMLEVKPEQILPTVESVEGAGAWTQDLPHSPKRRKIEHAGTVSQGMLNSPVRHSMFKHPTTPASALRAGPQQFTRASSVATSVADDVISVRRPTFLRSSVAPAEQFEPLPEAFSPHRRGEKFVPGGMAATLQQWVVETGQAAAHSRRGQGYLIGEAYLHRVMVESKSGRNPMLVQGRFPDGAQAWLILLFDRKRALNSEVLHGSVVGIRSPCWEVEVEGRSWVVGIDWKLLS